MTCCAAQQRPNRSAVVSGLQVQLIELVCTRHCTRDLRQQSTSISPIPREVWPGQEVHCTAAARALHASLHL